MLLQSVVVYAASCGSISSAGTYVPPPTTGTCQVIATRGGKADTSVVTIINGVAVAAGQSLQSAVTANPPGTAFVLGAGTYPRQSVIPKNRDSFIGQGSSTILDGENVTACAFCRLGSNPDSVTLTNLRVTRYNSPSASGAINAGDYPVDGTLGWVIDGVRADHNAQLGIRLGHRMTVRNSRMDHNGLNGIGGAGDDVLIESNEIDSNGVQGVSDVGGTKLVLGNRLVFRNNYVHDNHGPNVWLDIANRNFLIEGNRVEQAGQEGIVIEISQGPGVIRNNAIRWSGLKDPRRNSWLWGAGIGIHASGGVEVYGNTLDGNAHGIALLQQARGTLHADPQGADPEMYVQNVWVHDNTVTCGPGSITAAGAANEGGFLATFTTRNNRFTGNSYVLTGCSTAPFAWMNNYRTQAQWLAYGQDPAASPSPSARGIGIGPANGTPGSLGTLFINANSPSNLKSQLAAAEAGGYQIIGTPTGGGHSQYLGSDGYWSLSIWKSKIDAYRADSATWRKYYQKGVLVGVSLIDEPQCASCWGGKVVAWNTVGLAACYARGIFGPTPLFTRSNATQIAAGTTCLDGGWLGYSAALGSVATFAATETAAAKSKGLVLMAGVNAENGGKVVSGCQPSVTRPGKCRMSAVELSTYLRALAADTTRVCGMTLWVGDASQWQSYTSVSAVRDTLTKLSVWGKTRARPARCGG